MTKGVMRMARRQHARTLADEGCGTAGWGEGHHTLRDRPRRLQTRVRIHTHVHMRKESG